MMDLYETHSLEPGLIIYPETWEVEKIQNEVLTTKKKIWLYVQPKYNQQSIDLARLVTSNLWEDIFRFILKWKIVKNWSNKWYDLIWPNWTKFEIKTGRIQNSAVIKKNQLEWMKKESFYWIMFYRTTDNSPPSEFTSQNNWLSPIANLKRNIQKKITALIIPRSQMVYYYNTCNLVEWKIKTTWINHIPLCLSNALKIFEENHWNYQQYEYEREYLKFLIKIYSLGYEIK